MAFLLIGKIYMNINFGITIEYSNAKKSFSERINWKGMPRGLHKAVLIKFSKFGKELHILCIMQCYKKVFMQNLLLLQHNKNKCNLLQKQTQLKNKKTSCTIHINLKTYESKTQNKI